MAFATTAVPQNADGVFIWVGSGDAATFPNANTDNYSRILLIVGDKLQQEHLLQLQQTDAKISVLQHAVATEDGPAQLYRYNLNQFNSMQPATGLLQLYPGLKLQEKSSVQAISFATLVREQQLASQDYHTLVFSAPAPALPLLQSLAEQQLLTLFSQLIVQTAAIELYQGAGTCQELESWLLLQGYLRATTDNSDPDLLVVTFHRHALLNKVEALVIANNQLAEQLTASQAGQQMLRKQFQQQLQQFNDTAELMQDQQSELSELTQANIALTNRIEQIKTQHSAELQTLQEKLQQAELLATEAQRRATADAEHVKQQIQALETTLQVTSSSNTELAAKTESMALLNAQAEQAVLELQQKLLQSEQLVNAERKSALAANAEFEKQLQACEQQMQAVKDNSAGLVAKVDSLQNQKVQMDKTVADLQQQLDKHKSDLTTVTKHAAARLEKINQLESTVRRQQEENQQLSARQHALQQEMLKAEAQIDLIKELILKE